VCMTVRIPVSLGELIDKITILQIKSQKLTDVRQKTNVDRELAELEGVLSEIGPLSADVGTVMDGLRSANMKLWDIEDDIRRCEREKHFDEEFIRLARAVYFTNDERANLKRKINTLLDSELVEEKSYEPYN